MDESKKDDKQNIVFVLRKFISENFLPSAGLDEFEDNDSFMQKGILDSTGVLELIEYIEEHFNISVEDEEIIPDNLDSLAQLTSFINRKLAHAGK
jgi:acyl carrier protein